MTARRSLVFLALFAAGCSGSPLTPTAPGSLLLAPLAPADVSAPQVAGSLTLFGKDARTHLVYDRSKHVVGISGLFVGTAAKDVTFAQGIYPNPQTLSGVTDTQAETRLDAIMAFLNSQHVTPSALNSIWSNATSTADLVVPYAPRQGALPYTYGSWDAARQQWIYHDEFSKNLYDPMIGNSTWSVVTP